MTNVFTKDPDSVLDFRWDWSDWLEEDETITDAVITMPDGLTLDSQVDADQTVTAFLSGGTAGDGYKITCHIETSNNPPREDDRSIYIKCQER